MPALKRIFIDGIRLKTYLTLRNYSVRVRFAPSPTGHLHLGGLRTALYNYLYCRKNEGKYILRIEDTDQTRLVDGATEHLINMLNWAGMEFNEGPHVGGKYGPYIQSERLNIYKKHCDQLMENNLAYRCFCSPQRLELLRKQAASRGEVPKYDNRCRHLDEGEVEGQLAEKKSFTIRFKLSPNSFKWHDMVYGTLQYNLNEGDPIIMKSDGYPTYHFANVVDDHLMEISHVLRGVEWQVSTPKHLLLYEAFGWKAPKFAHLPLLQNTDGKKLSKRQNDVFVENYKTSGFFPEAVLNLVTNAGSGFDVPDTSGMNVEELSRKFDVSRLQTNSSKVDFNKIYQFNQLHLKLKLKDGNERSALMEELRKLVKEHYEPNLTKNECLEELSEDHLDRVFSWTKNRIFMLSDLLKPEYAFLWIKKQAPAPDKAEPMIREGSEVSQVVDDRCRTFILDIIGRLSSRCRSSCADPGRSEDHETVESLTILLRDACQSHVTLRYSQAMKVMRQALSGPKEGPSVAEIMAMLGRDGTIARLKSFLN